ncbi:hypothetical protein SLS58_008944 [Diplodia intermedia]|uniref:Heterokaryon incompatibility domain-containing protein n=1 Tax=Diplodia intermedia TaxID=856260 RepID=A0ABR3TFC2_9PEZI
MDSESSDPLLATHLCDHCHVIRLDDFDTSDECLTWVSTLPSEHGCGLVKDGLKHFYRPLEFSMEDSLPDLPTLQRSSRAGCAFCRLLLAGVKETVSRPDVDVGDRVTICNLRYEWCLCPYRVRYRLRTLAVSIRLGEEDHDIFFQLSSPQEDPPQFDRPLSERAAASMKSWLSSCAETCHPLPDSYPLPTRLIDVGEPEGKEPRLVETSAMAEQGPTPKYAALSYCWGPPTDRTLRTEHDSIQSHSEEIKLQRFPKTIRDAILVTRALDLQYLWVDALCIIQNDTEDWATEASRMCDVYHNAYVTLIPFTSESCDDGFLDHRSSRPSIEIPFQSTTSPDTIRGSYFLHAALPHRDHYWYGADVTQSQWRTRGWTMQEEHLSPRKLLFGATRTVFECADGNTNWDRPPAGAPQRPEDLSLTSSTDLPLPAAHKLWLEHATSYTDRALSDPLDKLPAVAGYARLFHTHFGRDNDDQYVAGLWRSTLHAGLLWHRVPSRDAAPASLAALLARLRHDDTTPYVAPSWSWAATDQQLFGGSRAHDAVFAQQRAPACRVVEAASTPAICGDVFGRLEAVHLTLRGRCMALPHDDGSASGRLEMTTGADYFGYVTWKLRTRDDDAGERQRVLCLLDWNEGPAVRTHAEPGFCARAALFVTAGDAGCNQFWGLVLYRLDDDDDDGEEGVAEWVRIGVFDLHWPGGDGRGADELPGDVWGTRTVKIV